VAAPILKTPLWDRPFVVATDASQYRVSAVLYQWKKKGEPRYIEFIAKSLNKA
jgi:hypothetical protein